MARDDAKLQATQPLAKKALAGHSVVGLVISTVLYVIVLSGMLSVFKDEFQLIEQVGEPEVGFLSPVAAQNAALNAMLLDPETRHLYIHMPVDGNPRAIVETDNKETYVSANGDIAVTAHVPWTDFLIDLHYYLNLPSSFGMQVVAIFGVFLFLMSITGLLAHPNIFRDAFTFRGNKSEQVKQVDLHNRLSVWTAPFHISNALTGAMIGLASFSALAIGTLKYDGNAEAVFEPVFGSEPAVELTPAPLANIERVLNYMADVHPEKQPVYVILHDPGTKGQYLQIMAEHPDRLIYAEKYNFNGAGDFIDTVGSADGTVGQQVADSVYKIHFGSFGGMPVKLAFGIFGFCLLIIITAGMKLYFIKQRAGGKDLLAYEAAWSGIVWGAPAMLVLTALYTLTGLTTGLSMLFWIGIGLSVLGGIVRGRKSRLELAQNVADELA